ncbi:MAG TPA: hypothetical protein PK452_05225, partial [Amaricoccus sp.]|nr:hypothetical protein [Amaricoccus sp.]
MPRRRRGLTPEDRKLWETVAATATPLHPRSAPGEAGPRPEPAGAAPRPPAAAAPEPPGPPAWPGVRLPEPPRVTLDLAADPHRALDRAHPHMDRRRFDKLRR